MSSKLFELRPVVSRVELEAGEKVETLEYSVGSLFIGTSAGNLVQYGLAERTDESGQRQFSANYITTKVIVAKSRVSFLYAAPAINRLLVLCDSTLFILNMSDLTILPMAGSNKLKGVSAVCINNNPTMDNPFSVEVCVAKKKQCQLALLTLTEDKLSVSKTRECSHPVLAMAMDGVYVCAALTTQYIVYNMENMTDTELFPLDPQSELLPTITRVDREEFLVLGPGNLGMFVKATGIAGRPPIQWSANFSNIVYTHPYIIGQGSELVAVYSIRDQGLKQGLSYSGGRFVGFFDGNIFLASSNNIDCVVPVPWEQQASSLLESGQVEEAVLLAKDTEEGNRVRQKAGFMYLKEGNFMKAEEMLLKGSTDVREVLSIFPGMLPIKSKFVRSIPPLHTIPDISSIKHTEIAPNQFLVSYLQSVINREGNSLESRTEVHTAMVKVLCDVSPTEVVAFLKDENTLLDQEDLAEFFIAKGLQHFLAVLHWKDNNAEAALKIWSLIVTEKLSDEYFPGVEFFCRQLSLCSEELMYNYCDVALQKDIQIGAKLFMKPQINFESDNQFIDNALNILSKYPEARTIFLEFLVLERKSDVEKHHTQLAMAFINQVKMAKDIQAEELSQNLSKLILTSKHLNAKFLLQNLKDTDLNYEKAILHGKLGEHDRALDILVNKLKDYKLAEHYCDDISANQPESKAKLLFLLLNIYMNPTSQMEKDKFTTLAVDLINNRAEDLNGTKVISILPETWNISIILPALRKFSRNLIHTQRMTKISKHLYKGENIQVHNKLVGCTKDPIFVMPNNYCVVCQKPFTSGGIARYPNGVMLHQDCIKDGEVCPITGEVFKIKL
eukprot:GFUD01063332.1.p1 GENE.GFUD01063332.1~~GFUD01063332.1.p1  ORF type:complete len:841 (+),score=220.95 GFUD01063332.1:74-2596(+)